MFRSILILAVWGGSILAPSIGYALASSTNYQLGYAATDGGGGAVVSGAYRLEASAIGTSLGSGDTASGVNIVSSGTQWIDDDGDGLDSGVEQSVFNTEHNNADTDSDGLADGVEVITHGTDPTLIDTDGDTFFDGDEVSNGWDPLNINSPIEFIENVPMPVWALIGMLGLFAAVRRGIQVSGRPAR